MPAIEIRLILAALATWRLTYMLTEELGPFDVFKRLRDRVGVHYLRDDSWPDTNLGRLFSCCKCLSMWTGAVFGLLALTPLWWAAIPFALSAPVVFIRDRWGYPPAGD